ncbi:hypothetical protein C7476_12219 [Phyllobacterium bourgognense]|uniref:Uncharacterized protein n=1 Tax=Phyllobacterium bourgognense TaxID=314236 RepID=A0A368YIJ3_9HYPH|nr:hypothetical protein C7476_12219 [Phyllobacterium bourgognense]
MMEAASAIDEARPVRSKIIPLRQESGMQTHHDQTDKRRMRLSGGLVTKAASGL